MSSLTARSADSYSLKESQLPCGALLGRETVGRIDDGGPGLEAEDNRTADAAGRAGRALRRSATEP